MQEEALASLLAAYPVTYKELRKSVWFNVPLVLAIVAVAGLRFLNALIRGVSLSIEFVERVQLRRELR